MSGTAPITSAVIPGQPGPHLMQAAFLVEDLEAAARAWTQTTGIGPFFIVPHIQLAEFDYRGEKGAGLDFSVALAQSGGVQIELIQQHCDNPSAYRDLIAKGQQGFHHFCIYTPDYDATRQRYIDQGFISAVDGVFGAMRFCYVDTSPALGCMIEIVEQDEGQTAFFTRVAEAAADWDGVTDPIRPGFPD
ncbi:VOC family protein [Novosphingobium sp. KCTC 2891]|uniref:VOC family protein n=1 Tax=Novosphingobium sp. KCTC 2891 TaxID=2989730 RepID=UPI002222D728|nr:VOC family protein [Novosphingobium sp. KCTC 2891]MCW1382756.1 VOC family protein [Novosphingobium sp. KCTC 2891]